MDWNAVFIIGVFAVGAGILLYLPFFIWFRWQSWRQRRGRRSAPASLHVTSVGVAFHAVMLAVLFAGLSVGVLSPSSWFGGWVSTVPGVIGYVTIVSGLTFILDSVLAKRGVVLHHRGGVGVRSSDLFVPHRGGFAGGYLHIRRLKICGATVHVHWSAPVLGFALFATSIKTPLLALESALAYFSIIVVHEAGHAFMARRLGYPPRDIYVGYFHGLCSYEQPYSQKEDCLIAWGGVGAQLLLALPLVVLAALLKGHEIPVIYVLTSYLGYLSILVACLNLLPFSGLDGAKAWRLIPIYVAELRQRRQAAREVQKLLRRIK